LCTTIFFSKLWFARLESMFTQAAPQTVTCASPTPFPFSPLRNLFNSGLSEKVGLPSVYQNSQAAPLGVKHLLALFPPNQLCKMSLFICWIIVRARPPAHAFPCSWPREVCLSHESLSYQDLLAYRGWINCSSFLDCLGENVSVWCRKVSILLFSFQNSFSEAFE